LTGLLAEILTIDAQAARRSDDLLPATAFVRSDFFSARSAAMVGRYHR
jgi:hypothetical protein